MNSKMQEIDVKNRGKLRVWHIPQVPGESFYVYCDSEEEAVKLMHVLAYYDMFQYQNDIKPDYCNASGVEIWDGDDWVDWYKDSEDDYYESIEEYCEDSPGIEDFKESLKSQIDSYVLRGARK